VKNEEQSSKCDAKIKEGIFTGPQIRELIQDKQFDEDLNETERNAWLSFKMICKDFLGNQKAANYQDVGQDLLTSHKAMSCNMSLKIHFLESHLDVSRKILAKSVTNTVKDFTKLLELRKSGTRASDPQICCQTIAGN
jgi:F0F1-type ATP synthase alpha subunit